MENNPNVGKPTTTTYGVDRIKNDPREADSRPRILVPSLPKP